MTSGLKHQHYELISLLYKSEREQMEWLKWFFRDGPDRLNFCLFSTSGVHGSYATLDSNAQEEPDKDGCRSITFLVCSPRLVRFQYGNARYTKEEEPWLRWLATESLRYIRESQAGNLLDPAREYFAGPPGSCQHQFYQATNGKRHCRDCGEFIGYTPGCEP
jgi:hypothetical protein